MDSWETPFAAVALTPGFTGSRRVMEGNFDEVFGGDVGFGGLTGVLMGDGGAIFVDGKGLLTCTTEGVGLVTGFAGLGAGACFNSRAASCTSFLPVLGPIWVGISSGSSDGISNSSSIDSSGTGA